MRHRTVCILIPLTGYVGLWVLGSVLFLVYFGMFHISTDLGYVAMIQELPPLLAIVTVPLCSFASFFTATKVILRRSGLTLDAAQVFRVGVTSLLVTIGLDLLTTVAIEQIDILAFPVNLMYLFAWFVIVPSVVLAGHPDRAGPTP